jgi:hypothetical protein
LFSIYGFLNFFAACFDVFSHSFQGVASGEKG